MKQPEYSAFAALDALRCHFHIKEFINAPVHRNLQ
jgi:hypothetical protein